MLVSAKTWTMVVAVALVVAGSATAQPNFRTYGEQAAKGIQSQNSASNFTSSRINRQILNQSVSRSGVAGVNARNYTSGLLGTGNAGSLAGPPSRSSKPFSAIDRGPTVSPYLSLSNPFSTATDYYNVVKPLQEQRRVNDRVMKQQYMQAKKLNQIAAQGPYQITGNENAAPTGHSSGFMKYANYMNTGGYFAPPTQPKSAR
jgi:hypothetical protein